MNKAVISQVNEVLNKYVAGNVNGAGFQVPKEHTPLCDLAYNYQTDKVESIKHPYTHFYYDLFEPQKNSVRRLLEIGIGLQKRRVKLENRTGASLYMWKDFFPRAQIYGADVDPRTMFRDGRIQTLLADQANVDDLRELIKKTGSNLDVVIDDGSHQPIDQITTAQTLMPLLKKDVIYIIEDVADQSIEKKLRNFDTTVISLRNSNGKRFPDDKLIIVRNKGLWV